MRDSYVDCPEVAGKIIKNLRLYNDTGDGMELQIDFPDGTIFTCCFGVKPTVEASVSRPGVGPPEILRKYDLE